MPAVDKRITDTAKKVKGKRPRAVIDHILKHGMVTTQQLRDIYGYNHPPRAARDVHEEGIPLDTFRVKGADGRKIGAYQFGDPGQIQHHKLGGRKVFSKAFKKLLLERQGSRCAITGEEMKTGTCQVDHRVPYEVAGDEIGDEHTPEQFMLVSGAAQRQKSWSCEHCPNLTAKDRKTCLTCYWSSPEDYTHVATIPLRRVDLLWKGEEIATYEELRRQSEAERKSIQHLIKERLTKK